MASPEQARPIEVATVTTIGAAAVLSAVVAVGLAAEEGSSLFMVSCATLSFLMFVCSWHVWRIRRLLNARGALGVTAALGFTLLPEVRSLLLIIPLGVLVWLLSDWWINRNPATAALHQ